MSDYFSRLSRLARRSIRATGISKLADALHGHKNTKTALTTQNAGVNAVVLAREIFDNYELPSRPKLSYSGIRDGKTAAQSSSLTDGVVTVFAEFRTRTGVLVGIDLPIEIRNGEFVEPSVIVHNGSPRVIAQSTFDDITSLNTSYHNVVSHELYSPTHPEFGIRTERFNTGLFSVQSNKDAIRRALTGQAISPLDSSPGPTFDEYGHQITQPLPKLKKNIPGQFGYNNTPPGASPMLMDETKNLRPQRHGPSIDTTRNIRKAPPQLSDDEMQDAVADTAPSLPWEDKVGQYRDIDKAYLEPDRNSEDYEDVDVAERQDEFTIMPGSEVKIKHTLEVKDRGGVTHEFTNGTSAFIVRDLAGDNREFLVRFDNGLEALVERRFLRQS